MKLSRVCVFCGSRRGVDPACAEAARATGRLLAERGIGVVFGGGSVGLMGVVADAALQAGGEVIGVIPDHLVQRELAHRGVTRMIVTDSMHTRKARMVELADAFIALPGGAGTLDELFEIWTWAQLGLHHKPFGLINVAGYYDALLAHAERMVAEGFLAPEFRAMLAVAGDAGGLLAEFARRSPPARRFAGKPPRP